MAGGESIARPGTVRAGRVWLNRGHSPSRSRNRASRVADTGVRSAEYSPFGGWATLAAAGLLAGGCFRRIVLCTIRRRRLRPAFPVSQWLISFGRSLPTHSCGGSRGFVGLRRLTPFPFASPKGTVAGDNTYQIAPTVPSADSGETD